MRARNADEREEREFIGKETRYLLRGCSSSFFFFTWVLVYSRNADFHACRKMLSFVVIIT